MAETNESLTIASAAQQILAGMDEPAETPTEPKAEQASPETGVEETQEVSGESTEESASHSVVSQDDVQTSEDTGTDTGVTVSTLSELAEATETDLDFLYNLKMPIKLGAESKEITLGEMKDLAQDHESAKTQLEAVAQTRHALEAERTQSQTQFGTRLQELAGLVQAVEAQLTQDENSDEMKQLRQDEPAEYAIRLREVDNRKTSIQQIKSQAMQLYNQQGQDALSSQNTQKAETIQSERAELLRKIPEWADEEVAKADNQKIAGFLSEIGFTNEEIGNCTDHRMVILARKAMMGNVAEQTIDPAKKRVAKLPKVVKAGTVPPKEGADSQKVKSLKKRLGETGKLEDAAKIILMDL